MVNFNNQLFFDKFEPAFKCLFNQYSQSCTYNPLAPSIYFSLGDAIAALGLIFAVVQLSKPVWSISLIIRGKFFKNIIWILSGIGLICILIASLLPNFPYLFIPPPLNYPLFWEQLGFIFFATSPIAYLFFARKYDNLFSKNSAERFYYTIMDLVARGEREDIQVAIDILNANIKQLIIAVKVYDNNYYHKTGEVSEEHEYSKYAESLLNLVLSESLVADYVATKRIDFLFHLIRELKNQNLSRWATGNTVSEIINKLFTNTESYLFKQLDSYRGISLYAPVDELIFKNLYMIETHMVLRDWEPYRVTRELLQNEDYIKVYLRAIECVIETCRFYSEPSLEELRISLYKIEDFVQKLMWSTKKRPSKWSSEVERFYGHTFLELYKKAMDAKTVCDVEKQVARGRKYRQCLTAAYAETLVEIMGHLASLEDRNLERDYALDLTYELLPISSSPSEYDNIRKCFLDILWEKIEENVNRGYFPAVLRIYIEIMSWKGKNDPQWRKDERRKLLKYLNRKLKPKIAKGELMANYKDTKEHELLPDYIAYNKQTNKFMSIGRDGSRKLFR